MHDLKVDRRQFQRVLIHAPVEVRWTDGVARQVSGFSRNMSSKGIFFVLDGEITARSRVELRLYLPAREAFGSKAVFYGVGSVVRLERTAQDPLLGVAVALEETEIFVARSSGQDNPAA